MVLVVVDSKDNCRRCTEIYFTKVKVAIPSHMFVSSSIKFRFAKVSKGNCVTEGLYRKRINERKQIKRQTKGGRKQKRNV